MRTLLNIVGPQGCGKSSLADKIVQFTIGSRLAAGVPRIDPSDLLCAFPAWLLSQPEIVIVETDAPMHEHEFGSLIAMATSRTLVVKRKGQLPVEVSAPTFIVCSEHPIADTDDRRVLVIGGGV